MAAVVFLSHIGKQKYSGGFLWQMTAYGEDAVDVFFVLSGFVIASVTAGRENNAARVSPS